MKNEYDFSSAERGKFYHRDARLIPPVRLDPEILSYLSARADALDKSLDELVNDLLRKEIELIESGK